MQLFLLDIWGVILALALAGMVYFLGGAFAAEYLFVMLVFLVSGTAVTVMGKERKESMGMYEYGRSWQNVLANGVVPVACLALNAPSGYFGAIAAITADKFSSEIGTLGGTPVFIGDLKPAKKGTSGAVTALGTFAGFIGAELVAVCIYFLFPGISPAFVLLLPFVGVLGSLADSVAGVFETRGAGDKATSNLAGALTGALFGQLLFILFGGL